MDAMSGLGAVLLPVVAGLLLEELTLGGLVRLLLAPRPETKRCVVRRERQLASARGRGEPKSRGEMGGARCSH
jgi:hypothetical protein